MIKLVVFNQKGGVGKSTTVVDIAGCLSKDLKKKVLVIDIDGQCTSSSYLKTIEGMPELSLYDYLYNGVSASAVISPVKFDKWDIKSRSYQLTIDTKISVVPSSRFFSKKDFSDSFTRKELFLDFFEEIGEDTYDYCIFDCPGYINKLTEAALLASDYILIPALADIDSLVGFSDLIDTKNHIREESDNVGLDILGIVFTMFSGSSLNRQIKELCYEQMGEDVIFNTYIRRSAAVSDARAVGKPISYYRPNEPAAEDYLTLTKEIIKRIKQRKK